MGQHCFGCDVGLVHVYGGAAVILPAGTFRVADFRKAIPAHVKIQVLLDYVDLALRYVNDLSTIVPSWKASELEFDHDPALVNRPYDTKAEDFVPPQNDPTHITVRCAADHQHKTTGRRPGADRTIHTRDSDVGEAKRTRKIRASEAKHKAAMSTEALDVAQFGRVLHKRPKQKIAARANPWPKGRKMQSRGFSK